MRNRYNPQPARERLARRIAATAQPEPQRDSWDHRMAAARAAIAPAEPAAYRFIPTTGGFVIVALTEADIAKLGRRES